MYLLLLVFFSTNTLIASAGDPPGPFNQDRLKQMVSTVQEDVSDRVFQVDIAREILRGAHIHDTLLAGDRHTIDKEFPVRHDAIRSLVWWFYALGQKSFYEGTFVVADTPQHALLTFLTECPKAYRRCSTHFGANGSEQWGLDLYDLPTKTIKRTILFGAAGSDINGEHALVFIKPETWGLASWPQFLMHAMQVPVCIARKLPYVQWLVGTDDQQGYNKERIPNDIWYQFIDIIQAVAKERPDDEDFKPEQIKIRASTRGIAFMQHTLKSQHVHDEHISRRIKTFLQTIQKKYDHIDQRYGNEIIIMARRSACIKAVRALTQEQLRQRLLNVCIDADSQGAH